MLEEAYFTLSMVTTREQFVERCPFPFFIGADVLTRPQGPSRTLVESPPSDFEPLDQAPASRPLVLPIRKVQPVFPSMISVGRTSNNDIVIADVQVSKVHAYVRLSEGRYELSDAGSRNGTFVGSERLAQKGRGRILESGAAVRFGNLEFVYFDPETCWARLRSWKR